MFPVQIEGPRILLRELMESDWTQVQEYAGDPEVVKYEVWGPNTEEQSREFIRHAMSCQQDKPRKTFEFAVTLKDSGKLIGGCGIRIKDPTQREGDLGYSLLRNQWGKGLGTEVAKALISFGLKRLGLHRVWATCHVENKASARVLEKAGMRREGVLRKNKLQRGEWRDSCLFAVLETD
jgi:RimJ/RimL family protein N-acetyltransferase